MKNINNIIWKHAVKTDFQNRVYSLLKSLKYHWRVKKLPLCWVWHLFDKEVPKSLQGFIGGSQKTVNGDTVYWDNNGYMWSDDRGTYTWGCSGTLITGADSDTDGKQNTQDILSGCGDRPIAASGADNLNYAGFSDWWLPAKTTLQNYCSEGGPGSGNYWSSTEDDSTRAYSAFFSDCSTYNSNKYWSHYVRCVRGPVYHIFSNNSPLDGAMGVTSKTLSVDVRHLDDGSTSDVEFWVDGSKVGTDTNVASGGTASYTASGLSSGDYNWYVIADDGTNTTQSATWSFTYGVSDTISKNVNLRF